MKVNTKIVWKLQNSNEWNLYKNYNVNKKVQYESPNNMFKLTTSLKKSIGTLVYTPLGFGIVKNQENDNNFSIKLNESKQENVFNIKELYFEIPLFFKYVKNNVISQQFGFIVPMFATAEDIYQKINSQIQDSQNINNENQDDIINDVMIQVYYKANEIKSSKIPLEKLKITPNSLFLVFQQGKVFDSILLTQSNWIKFLFECFDSKLVKLQLIFRASRDGFSAKQFHEKCNNQGPTLVIAKSSEQDEPFGGYCDKDWKNANNYVNCKNGWIFSTKVFQKFHIIQYNQYAYYDYVSYGPAWGGGHDLYISDNGKNCYSNLGHTYGNATLKNNTEEARTCIAGKYQFTCTDYEVFKVIQ